MPTAGEFSRRSHHKVDISDFENMDIASSANETLIIDPNILDVVADVPPKNQWTEHLVEYPVIAFIDAANGNVNRFLNSTVNKNIFILDIRFLSISVHVVVLYVVGVMYLYLFSRINYSCMASPIIQL